MELSIEQAPQKDVNVYRVGKLQEAERLYRAILDSKPAHPYDNHNLGVLAVYINKVETTFPLFKTTLDSNSKIKQFWLSYIDTLIKEKHFENAKRNIDQSKKQDVAEEKLMSWRHK